MMSRCLTLEEKKREGKKSSVYGCGVLAYNNHERVVAGKHTQLPMLARQILVGLLAFIIQAHALE